MPAFWWSIRSASNAVPREGLVRELLVHIGEFVAGICMVLISFKVRTFYYLYSKEPFPNQRFAKTAFFVVGVVLILGGLWGLWLGRPLALR
jgi:hypothetical protein